MTTELSSKQYVCILANKYNTVQQILGATKQVRYYLMFKVSTGLTTIQVAFLCSDDLFEYR
jgi:hypothetical protein